MEVDVQDGRAVGLDSVTQRGREDVHRSSLDPLGGDGRVAPDRRPPVGDAHVLERSPAEALREHRRPPDEESAVGGPKRGDGHAGPLERPNPGAVRADPGPAGAAEGEDGDVGRDVLVPLRPG